MSKIQKIKEKPAKDVNKMQSNQTLNSPVAVSNARIIIENVTPTVDKGNFPVKRVTGEQVVVRADVFTDGHDQVLAFLLFKDAETRDWQEMRMKFLHNDAWEGSFTIATEKDYIFTVRGYASEFTTWQTDLKKKIASGVNIAVDLQIGARMINETALRCLPVEAQKLTAWAAILEKHQDIEAAMAVAVSNELLAIMEANMDVIKSVTFNPAVNVEVDRVRSLFSSWYELFPRSWSAIPGQHGTFKDCERILPEIARMGFDVIYLPPIHPIGQKHRKGKNNSKTCTPVDPGCPWAIGGAAGGHKSIHPELGTMDDFKSFISQARALKMEVALDIAFQCSPDHSYVKDHPQWFKWRPDGTVQYAENPPKKYEDVLPFNFDTPDWQNLWEELKSIFIFWASQGVRIFRVDNPHTKPFLLWDWLIAGVKKEYPDAIFLAEAFTRPKIMYRLAKGGFSQSYTYFTWRNTKKEFEEYLTELSQTNVAEFFRPNFWPNTPDILAEHLQHGVRASFMMRAALAATMSSNWGIYGPAFELCLTEPFPGKEEYNDNEKYEIKQWDWDREGNIKDFIAVLNRIRKENPALQQTRNIRFAKISNEQILAYYKATDDLSNILIIVVNLDPHHTQTGWLEIPWHEFGFNQERVCAAKELIRGEHFSWNGASVFIELDPNSSPVQVIRINQEIS